MNLGYFFHEKSFVLVEIIFFRSKFGENSPIKEVLHNVFGGCFTSAIFRSSLERGISHKAMTALDFLGSDFILFFIINS
jgi:hypothetical protein